MLAHQENSTLTLSPLKAGKPTAKFETPQCLKECQDRPTKDSEQTNSPIQGLQGIDSEDLFQNFQRLVKVSFSNQVPKGRSNLSMKLSDCYQSQPRAINFQNLHAEDSPKKPFCRQEEFLCLRRGRVEEVEFELNQAVVESDWRFQTARRVVSREE